MIADMPRAGNENGGGQEAAAAVQAPKRSSGADARRATNEVTVES